MLNNLGLVLLNLKKYDEALQILEECERISKRSLGQKHVDYSLVSFNLGIFYYMEGEYEKARDYFKRS